MGNNKTRKIQVYSNCEDDRLDHNKSYIFHHFVSKRKALIEEKNSGILLVVRYNNFRFEPDKNEHTKD